MNSFWNATLGLVIVVSLTTFGERSYRKVYAPEVVKQKCHQDARGSSRFAFTECLRRNM